MVNYDVYRANLYALAAVCAFVVVYSGQVVYDMDCIIRTSLDASHAADTANRTPLLNFHASFNRAASYVHTHGDGTKFDDVSRTNLYALVATSADAFIYYRNSLAVQLDSSERTNPLAAAKANAPVGTAFRSA